MIKLLNDKSKTLCIETLYCIDGREYTINVALILTNNGCSPAPLFYYFSLNMSGHVNRFFKYFN